MVREAQRVLDIEEKLHNHAQGLLATSSGCDTTKDVLQSLTCPLQTGPIGV
jgi:hypothetical protein